MRDGKWEAANSEFRQYLATGGSFTALAEIVVTELHRPEFAYGLAQGNAENLVALADLLKKDQTQTALVTRIESEAFQLAKEQCASPNADPDSLARLADQCAAHNDLHSAIDLYRRAVAMNYNRTDWHFALGQLLAQAGQVDEAMREFHVCLRLDSTMAQARQRIGELSVGSRP